MKFLTATTYSESWQRVNVEDNKVHALLCISTSSPRVYVQGFFLSRVQIFSQQHKYDRTLSMESWYKLKLYSLL